VSGGILGRDRESWAELLRLAAAGFWVPYVIWRRPEEPLLWGPMCLMPLLSILALLAIRKNILPNLRRVMVAVSSVALLLYVVWALGSTTTPIAVFFVMTVLVATMASAARDGLLVAICVVLGYGGVLLLESNGIIALAPLARDGLGPHETSGGRPFAFISITVAVTTTWGYLLVARRKLERAAERERLLRIEQQRAQERASVLQQRLEFAERVEGLGRMAGGLAHDFRNLLTVIDCSFVYALETARADTEHTELREALHDGQSATRTAVGLTNRLLALGRRHPANPQVLDPGKHIVRTLGMLERALRDTLKVRSVLAPDLHPVLIDPAQLDQVLLNLALNAQDASSGSGELTFVARNKVLDAGDCESRPGLKPGPYVELVAQDDGCGMDPEILRRAAEPFFTTKPEGKGTGLGLALVYGIIRHNHGWFDLQSEPGVGTRAIIWLPRADGEQASSGLSASDAA
jgi:signal transduction histidine kinase